MNYRILNVVRPYGEKEPSCYSCKYFRSEDWTCTAYPKGIPEPIKHSKASHYISHGNDGGIHYSNFIEYGEPDEFYY